MLSLNLIVRAVIMHEDRFLVTAVNDGQRPLFYTFLGGHLHLGETLLQGVQREVKEEAGLEITPSRLLYVAENFFYRGTEKLHEIGYYFLCHATENPDGSLLEALKPNLGEEISPELMDETQLLEASFQPQALRQALIEDAQEGFRSCPKLIVVNELPGDIEAPSGLYRL